MQTINLQETSSYDNIFIFKYNYLRILIFTYEKEHILKDLVWSEIIFKKSKNNAYYFLFHYNMVNFMEKQSLKVVDHYVVQHLIKKQFLNKAQNTSPRIFFINMDT